jgi:hypothetical protein
MLRIFDWIGVWIWEGIAGGYEVEVGYLGGHGVMRIIRSKERHAIELKHSSNCDVRKLSSCTWPALDMQPYHGVTSAHPTSGVL